MIGLLPLVWRTHSCRYSHMRLLIRLDFILITHLFFTHYYGWSEGEIISKPQNFTVIVGQDVNLICEVDHNITATEMIAWSAAGRGLAVRNRASADNVRVHISNGVSTLTLIEVTEKDEHEYECLLPNEKQINYITVNLPPVITAIPEGTVQEVLGRRVELPCEAAGKPPPEVVWSSDDEEFSSSHDGTSLGLCREGTLCFPAVRVNDSGVYTCVAMNSAGRANKTVILDVLHAPIFREAHQRKHAAPGHSSAIFCDVIANPGINEDVQWTHNGSQIPDNRLQSLLDPGGEDQYTDAKEGTAWWRFSLNFDKFQWSDFGIYSCEGTNSLGSSTATITVLGTPQNLKILSSEHVDAFTPYTLTWTVASWPKLLHFDLTVVILNGTEKIDVSRLTIPAPIDQPDKEVNEFSYPLNDLLENTKYQLSLRAQNVVGYSDWLQDFVLEVASEDYYVHYSHKDDSGDLGNPGNGCLQISLPRLFVVVVLTLLTVLESF